MDALVQDLRYAARTLLRSPGFTLVAVLTLALGIGANTAMFGVVDGVLLRPAPVEDLGRTVAVWETDRHSGTTREPSSVPDYFDFQDRSRSFERLAAFTPAEVSLTPERGDPSRLAALAVTDGYLRLLGIRPLLGRGFAPDEDQPGAPRVALISEALWTQLFGRDSAVIGRTIRLNDVTHVIVGVLPASADFGTLQILGAAAYGRGFAERGGRTRVDVWAPLRMNAASLPRDTHPIIVLGRLRAGATLAQARQEMSAIAADLERTYPSNDARGVNLEPLGNVVFGPVRPALRILLGAVLLVLLVSCANVANLLLARGVGRTREVTLRAALGAGRGRLVRQFLVESAVLSTAGALAGVVLAGVGLGGLLKLAPAGVPRIGAVSVDLRVLGATLVVTVLVAAAFGLIPLLQLRRLNLQGALQGAGGRGATGSAHRRLRSALVVGELALAVMLLAGAGLLIRSLWALQQVDPGFRAAGLLKAEFQLPATRYPQSFANWPRWTEVHGFTTELRDRVAALPGVEDATVAGYHPLDAGFTSSISVVGREAEARDWPEPAIRQVDAHYFQALGVTVVGGRGFGASDDAAASPVAIVNEAAVRRFFPASQPIGHRIRLWGAERTIVGVVANERFHGLDQATPLAVYLPLAQAPTSGGSLLVRTPLTPASLAAAVRGVARDLDPALPLFGVEPLTETLSHTLAQRRFTMLVLGAFAAIALLLAAIGVHGVVSYTVAQRTRELGIRLALGAESRSVRSLVLGQGAWLTGAGLALGLALALIAARFMRSLLYGVAASDALTFAAVALALGAVALLACWLPAQRAAKVDPVVALRAE
jgi:putative ABC transport system permease protein